MEWYYILGAVLFFSFIGYLNRDEEEDDCDFFSSMWDPSCPEYWLYWDDD